MFTGIISHLGKIETITQIKDWEISISIIEDGRSILASSFHSLILGASVACSGICLTLKKIENNFLFFDVSHETASKTNFLTWKIGSLINIEKSLKVGDEIGGHFVYGHVDTTAIVNSIHEIKGSYKIDFSMNGDFSKFIAQKGSVTIDGVSLTVNETKQNIFNVNIIPFTWSHTCFKSYEKGSIVNIEIDVLARYLEKLQKISIDN